VHVSSWREAYAGILPTALLDGLSAHARAAMWRGVMNDPGGMALFVAENEGRIVGFGACGVQRDASLKAQGYDGEVGAIYVLRAHQRVGLGRALMTMMAERLREQGMRGATLWVLRENALARSFYERLGGAAIGERTEEQEGVTLSEIAYGWRDLSRLMR